MKGSVWENGEKGKTVKYRKCLHLVTGEKEDEMSLWYLWHIHLKSYSPLAEELRKWMTQMWIFDIFDSIYSIRHRKVKEGRKWSSGPSIKRGGKGREMSAWNLLPSHLSSLSINYLIPWLVITHHPSKKEKNLISSLYFSLAQTQTKPSLAHISSLPLSPLDDINLPWGTQFVSDLIVWSYDRMMGESLLLILVLTVSEREASGIIGVQCLLS